MGAAFVRGLRRHVLGCAKHFARNSLADIVLGRQGPGGRLPFAIPLTADHLPPFDPDARRVEYGELQGQALLDRLGVAAAYPYRFGLTYGDL
jgi:beta-glucosidase